MGTPRPVVPTPQPATTIGLLNIVFGSILIAWSSLSVSSLVMAPIIRTPTEALAKSFERLAQRDHEKVLATLRGLEEDAATDEEKEVYRVRRAEVEKQGPAMPVATELMTAGMYDPVMTTWTWADSITALASNFVLVASGFGLILLTGWGRRLGVWIAGAKLVRLIVIWLIWILVVVPELSEKLGKAVEQMIAQQQAAAGAGGGALPFSMTTMYAVLYSAMGVGMIFLGAIYPVISLVALRRAGVRAACVDEKPAQSPDSRAEPVG